MVEKSLVECSLSVRLDNAKGILIFLVVVGHCIEPLVSRYPVAKILYMTLYTFHMPLFVFLSGYLSKNVDKVREHAFSQLLVVYIVFNSIFYFIQSVLQQQFLFSVVYPAWTLWYLLSLFTWRLLLKDLIRIRFILPISFALYLAVGCMTSLSDYLSLARSVSFLPFFLLGYFTSGSTILKLDGIPVMIPLILMLFVAFCLSLVPESFSVAFFWLSKPFSFHNIACGQGMFFRLLLLLGTFSMAISVLRMIPKYPSFITKIGRSTLVIYTLHIYIVMLLHWILRSQVDPIFKGFILFTAPFAIVAALCNSSIAMVFETVLWMVNKFCRENSRSPNI